jgi:hypothetical protein
VLSFTSIPQALAANTIGFSSLGTGCSTSYTGGFFESNRYVARNDLTISAINFLMGNGSTTNFSTARLYIYSDNPTLNTPNLALSTFNPDVLSGTGTTTAARFTGSFSMTAGTKFWIVPSLNASSLPWCYWSGVTTSSLTLNGVIPDTSTSLSNSSFRKVYEGGTILPTTTGWDFSADANQLWQLSIEIGPNSPVAASLSLSGGGRSATFRAITQIQAAVSANSKVSFYVGGKAIPKCLNVLSSAGIATCNWRPSVKGNNKITAKVTSLDSNYLDGVASSFEVSVTPRSGTR